MKNKTLSLVIPPLIRPCQPDTGVLALAEYLRLRGIGVKLIDASLDFFYSILSAESLSRHADELALCGASSNRAGIARKIARRSQRTIEALRNPATYRTVGQYRTILGELTETLKLVSQWEHCLITVSDFQHRELSPLCSADLVSIAREPERLPTYGHLLPTVKQILDDDPMIVGISCTYLSQVLHSAAVVGLLRQHGFTGTLVVGGALFDSWLVHLNPRSRLFEIWDAIVLGPGEDFLSSFCLNQNLNKCSGLLYPSRQIWNPLKISDSQIGFLPALEGIRWHQYLAPVPILPLATARGCYWKRCAFCPETVGLGTRYQQGNAELIARQMLCAKDEYGIGLFHLTDSAISPIMMLKLSEILADQDIRWYGFARLERQLLDPDFAQILYRGGCQMLQLGVESASDRLLTMMGKGVCIERATAILHNLHQSGIRTYAYMLFGLPTETIAEAHTTLDWMRSNAHNISFLNLSLMNLPRNGMIEKNPNQFGIKTYYDLDGKNDLSIYLGFQADEQLPDRRAFRKLLSIARHDPMLRDIILRTPVGFGANHAPFMPIDIDF